MRASIWSLSRGGEGEPQHRRERALTGLSDGHCFGEAVRRHAAKIAHRDRDSIVELPVESFSSLQKRIPVLRWWVRLHLPVRQEP